MTVNIVPGANVLSGGAPSDLQAAISVVTKVIEEGTTTDVIVGDMLLQRSTNASYDTEVQVLATHCSGVTFESLTPETCSVSPLGRVSRVSSGSGSIRVSARNGSIFGRKTLEAALSQTLGGTVDTLLTWAPEAGSLRAHMADKVNAAFSGKYPGVAVQDVHSTVQYDTMGAGLNIDTNQATPARVANAALLNVGCVIDASLLNHTSFSQFDTLVFRGTGKTPWRSSAPCHFISPRHAIFASHVGCFDRIVINTGSDFVTVNRLAYLDLGADLAMIYIDQDLPVGVNLLKFFPPNWSTYLPNSGTSLFDRTTAFPCVASLYNAYGADISKTLPSASRHIRPVTCARSNTAMVLKTTAATNGTESLGRVGIWPNIDPTGILTQYAGFSDYGRGGDSSSMVYAPVNNDLVAVAMYTSAVHGAFLANAVLHLPKVMNYLAAQNGDVRSYSLQTVDLGGFNAY